MTFGQSDGHTRFINLWQCDNALICINVHYVAMVTMKYTFIDIYLCDKYPWQWFCWDVNRSWFNRSWWYINVLWKLGQKVRREQMHITFIAEFLLWFLMVLAFTSKVIIAMYKMCKCFIYFYDKNFYCNTKYTCCRFTL